MSLQLPDTWRSFQVSQSPLLHHFPHRLERGPLPSTGITRPPRYYGPIRLPTSPGLALTGLRLVSRLRPRDGVSRVASALVVYVPSPLPRWSCWVLIAPFPSSGSFPCEVVRSASTLLFSRPAQRLLTLPPAHSPNRLTILSIEGFRRLVALPPAPIATGWSDPCREGFAPSQELCLSTAHDFIITTPGSRFSVHTADGAATEVAGAKVYDTVEMIASALAGAGGTFVPSLQAAFSTLASTLDGA